MYWCGPPKTRQFLTFGLLLAILVKIICYLYFRYLIQFHTDGEYSYLGNDHPRTWQISTKGPVKMPFEDSVWFAFGNGEADTPVWESQYPGNGMIHLGENKQPYSIGMFHEIRCISYLRSETIRGHTLRQINSTFRPSRLISHCLNYLRQMALCRADIDLEIVSILPDEVHEYEYRCNDWTAVYDAVEKNQQEYAQGRKL